MGKGDISEIARKQGVEKTAEIFKRKVKETMDAGKHERKNDQQGQGTTARSAAKFVWSERRLIPTLFYRAQASRFSSARKTRLKVLQKLIGILSAGD